MDHFNDYASFYPISSARDEFDAYQFPDRTSATEGDNYDVPYSSFTDLWGMPEHPESMAGSSTSLPATDSHEPLAPSTSYTNQTDDHGQPSYSGDYWPEVGQQAQPHRTGSRSQHYSFDGTVVPEPSVMDPTPDSFPLNNWRGNQSGPSTGTFHMENVYTRHQPGTAGPARTGPMSTGRFQPYGRSRARRSEHMNAEAGPSTLVPPPVLCVGLPTLQPSGGMISETTADAEKSQTITEEDEVSAEPKRRERPHREKMREYTARLHDWVQRRQGPQEAPDFNAALAIALETISTIRPLVYHEECLAKTKGHSGSTGPRSKKAEKEGRRRKAERKLFQALSKYYPMGPGQNSWTRPPLFLRVIEDLESRSVRQGPPISHLPEVRRRD